MFGAINGMTLDMLRRWAKAYDDRRKAQGVPKLEGKYRGPAREHSA